MRDSSKNVKYLLTNTLRTKSFWAFLFVTLLSQAIGAWIFVRGPNASIPLFITSSFLTISIAICIFLFHQYKSVGAESSCLSEEQQAAKFRNSAKREIITIIPLFLGGIAGLCFLTISSSYYATLCFVGSLGLWAVLRYSTRKK